MSQGYSSSYALLFVYITLLHSSSSLPIPPCQHSWFPKASTLAHLIFLSLKLSNASSNRAGVSSLRPSPDLNLISSALVPISKGDVGADARKTQAGIDTDGTIRKVVIFRSYLSKLLRPRSYLIGSRR
ncbi:uncharacterized protein G2W53_005458 [Senna tora]|uniref:Uncharacterized protein n=1 Tax=Senna tora TaxID=362788 RepID=A0A834X2I2_9FABA|nr:uncharacterized protein G2W53_005458 [Senna tora]